MKHINCLPIVKQMATYKLAKEKYGLDLLAVSGYDLLSVPEEEDKDKILFCGIFIQELIGAGGLGIPPVDPVEMVKDIFSKEIQGLIEYNDNKRKGKYGI